MNTRLLINGKLVAGKGEKEAVLDPSPGRRSRSCRSLQEQIDAAVDAATRPSRPGRDPAEGPGAAVAARSRTDRGPGAGLRQAGMENCGKPYAA